MTHHISEQSTAEHSSNEQDREKQALRTWLKLLQTSNGLKKSIDTAFKREFGLSLARFDILSTLDRVGDKGITGKKLSKKLMVTEGNTSQHIAPLIKSEFVSRTIDENDRRVSHYRLTKTGQELFIRMAAAHQHWIAEAFRSIEPDMTAQLHAFLSDIHYPGSQDDDTSESNKA